MQHQSGATKYGFIKFSDPSVIDGIVERKVGLFALCFGVMVNEQEIVCAGVSIPLERASRRPSFATGKLWASMDRASTSTL